MQLSFIILNYRSEKYLEACIASIFKKVTGIEFEIIVVNNDEEKIKLKSFYGDNKKIKISEINKNIGFARANNEGVKISTGEYLCFINPDANIVSGNIQEILFEFENDLEMGIIGPRIVKAGKVQEWSVGAELNVVEILRGKLGLAKSKKIWSSQKKVNADWVSGVSMFIRRNVFDAVSGFDENFFLYYEDVDLCKRVRGMHKKILYFPFFEVMHLEGGSSNKKYDQKLEYFKAQDYYYKKWFSSSEYCFLKLSRFFYLWRYKIRRDQ